MRPKSITFLCVILLIIGSVQLVGSMGALLIGNGIGPEKVFKSTEKYEVDEIDGIDAKYLIDVPESEVPAVEADEGQTTSTIPEHILSAAKYGFWVSAFFLLSVTWLWQMRTKGVYLFAAVCSGNIFTQVIWKPEWVMQSQVGMWFSLLLPVIYFAVVLPHWKTLNIPMEDRPKKPVSDVMGLDIFNMGTEQTRVQNQKTEKS